MGRNLAMFLGLALSSSAIALTATSVIATAQESAEPAPAPDTDPDTVLKTYSAEDKKLIDSIRIVRIGSTTNETSAAMIPSGATIREVRVFGTDTIAGIQLAYEDASGAQFLTPIAGQSADNVKIHRLAEGEAITAFLVSVDATALKSLRLETSAGRELAAGNNAGAQQRSRLVVPGEFIGLVAQGTGGLTQLAPIFKFTSEAGKIYADGWHGDGRAPFRAASDFGFANSDRLIFDSIAGESPPAGTQADSAVIPKGMELASMTVYAGQTVNGLQMAFRKPGETQSFPTSLIGVTNGNPRTIQFRPGESLESIIVRTSSVGIHGLMIQKKGGSEITFGDWEQPIAATPGSAQSFGQNTGGQSGAIVGLSGHGTSANLKSLGTIRLAGAVDSNDIAISGNRSDVACSTAAADATMASATDPKSIIQARAKGVILQRQFAAIQLDETQAAEAAQKFGRSVDACRLTIDGVWATDDQIVPNKALSGGLPNNLSDEGNDLISNGNYTSRDYVSIANSDDPDNQIALMDALGDGTKIFLNSNDRVSMANLLRGKLPAGTRKVFTGGGASVEVTRGPVSKDIQLFVTRNGQRTQFYRPTVDDAKQEAGWNDTFVIASTLDNLHSAYRGYDVTRDDPFFININSGNMRPIFQAANSLAYRYDEKQAVPVGLIYKADGGSGMMSTDTLITSMAEYQKSVSSAYGASLGYGKTPTENQREQGKTAVGASLAIDVTQSNTKGMREGSTASMAWGKAITRKYATVVNHAYAQLTSRFIDDLYTASASGNYTDFIKRYGTHYPYAVTFGQASRTQESFDQTTTADWASSSFGVSVKASGEYKGVTGTASYSRTEDESNSSNTDVSIRKSNLVSICTGGANAQAAQGEKDCPVLLDLRPIYELVSPMYFPDSPEWVFNTRRDLTSAVQAYLGSKANLLANDRQIEVWRVTMKQIRCVSLGSEAGNTAELQGLVKFSVNYPLPGGKQFFREAAGFNKPEGYLEIECNSTWANAPGTMAVMVAGTPDQIASAKIDLIIHSLSEVDSGDPDDVLKPANEEPFSHARFLSVQPEFLKQVIAPVFKPVTFSELSGWSGRAVGSKFTATKKLFDGSTDGNPNLDVEYQIERVR